MGVDVVLDTSMVVTLRDPRQRCAPGGGCVPTVREYAISVNCPRCGKPRGRPELVIRYDARCGHYYCVDHWVNPCGHVDTHREMLLEAELNTNPVRRGVARVSVDGRSWMAWSNTGCPQPAEPLSGPQRRLDG